MSSPNNSPNPNPNSPQQNPQIENSEKIENPSKNRPKGRKKALHKKKLQAIEKKVQTLTKTLNPIRFSPSKTLDFTPHEELLKNLGLWDFVHIQYDKSIRMDLITQLIVTYESKKRCGFVNGYRIHLNRAALGNALKLSTEKKKLEKNENNIVDVDTYDGEITSFVENMVLSYMVLYGEVANNVLSEIKSGKFERVDWAGLIWSMVEKEISQGVKLGDCWYASHLQYLIQAQNKDVFLLEEKEVLDEEAADVEVREKEGMGLDKAIELDAESVVVEDPSVELTLGQENVEKEEELDVKETKERDMMVVDESKDDVGKGDWILDRKGLTGGHFLQSCNAKEDTPKHTGEGSKDDVAQGKFGFDGENLTGAPISQSGNAKEDTPKHTGEGSKDDVAQGKFGFDGENLTGAPISQSCNAKEDTVMDADEKSKLEGGRERNFEEDGERNFEEGERSFEDEGEIAADGGEENGMKLDEEDDEEEEEDEMKLDEGNDEEEEDREFSLTPRIHGLGNDGYAGNLLQGIDSNHISYHVSGQFDDQSNMGIISPRAEPYSSSGGPSFFGNGMKRAISHDHDLFQEHLGGGSKRLRIDGSSSEPDFDVCMDQIQLWVGKAKDKYEGKRKDVEELSKDQQFWINEVQQRDQLIQQRDQLIEHLQKIKYEELQKKDVEIYRLDRELFVMGNLINGYRDALKATDKKFAEYRERCQLPEEPIYKDVGPGGLVLSTMEIERLRLKREEEDRVKRVNLEQIVKQFEEEFVVTFEGYLNQLQMMDTKLLDLEKKVSHLKSAKCKVLEAVDSAAPME